MKKKRKKIIIIVCVIVAVVALAVVGIIALRKNNVRAYVQPVSDLNMTWMLSGSTSSGTITESAQQDVYLSPEQSVAEVYVKDGDEVKAGDDLFKYDTKMLELDVKEQQLSVDILKNKIDLENKQLAEYRNIVPYVEPATEALTEPVTEAEVVTDEAGNIVDDAMPEAEEEIADEEVEDKQTYTQDEKNKLIADQELEIKKLENQAALAQNSLNQAQAKLENNTVKAEINGTVKNVKSLDDNANSGEPFLTVMGSSGVTVTGYVSELDLDSTNVGDTVNVTSWMSGNSTTAEIKSINDYPADNANAMTDGNPNTSFYAYTAYMENAEGFTIGEDVEIAKDVEVGEDTVVLEKCYVRTDDKGAYALVEEKGVLVRRDLKTKKAPDGSYVIITEGLSVDDKIAFPYGKTGKAGTKTTDKQSVSLF